MKTLLKKTRSTLLPACVTGIMIFLSLGLVLSGYGSEPEPADVIIILGGDDGPRVNKGGELFHAGYAKNILVTGIDSKYYNPERLDWRQKRLIELGIAGKAILVDTESETTWEEAVNSIAAMKANGWKSALVVSDPPHMLRLHFSWKKAAADASITFTLVPTNPDWWNPLFWWSNRTGFRFVISEVQKTLYYTLKYF